jgi:hypothetical protein
VIRQRFLEISVHSLWSNRTGNPRPAGGDVKAIIVASKGGNNSIREKRHEAVELVAISAKMMPHFRSANHMRTTAKEARASQIRRSCAQDDKASRSSVPISLLAAGDGKKTEIVSLIQ